jgi:hypothetical protein
MGGLSCPFRAVLHDLSPSPRRCHRAEIMKAFSLLDNIINVADLKRWHSSQNAIIKNTALKGQVNSATNKSNKKRCIDMNKKY